MKICLSLAESSLDLLESRIAAYSSRVPLLEVRLDHLARPAIPALPAGDRPAMIATCRPLREGGRFTGGESDRLELLAAAARSGFDWIDLEHDVERPPELPPNVGVIRSRHIFEAFPTSLDEEYQRLLAARPNVAKLAVQLGNTEQLVHLLHWMEKLPTEQPRVIIGMGNAGQPSRYLGYVQGNQWTYVSEGRGQNTAAGQFPLSEAEFTLSGIGPSRSTSLHGVIGNPVAHSLSPRLHNGLFRHYGLDRAYFPLQLDALGPWFAYLETTRFRFEGFSITHPFKREVVKFLDRIESPVEAINTVYRNEQDGWSGLNTDWEGFLEPIRRRGWDLKNRSVVIVGSGGVAETVVAAVKAAGARAVLVLGRNPAGVADFATRHQCSWELLENFRGRADLLVNATPVGQSPGVEMSPLRIDQLDFELVYDLIYSPPDTRLLQLARAKGLPTISGMEMFVEQAARQFQIWTGIFPDAAVIRRLMEAD